MKQNNKLTKIIGNFFIILSLSIALFIYYPIIQAYFLPQTLSQNVNNNSFYLEIPKLKLKSPIIANVDAFNEAEYKKALEKGVAQAAGTSSPGENGTTFIFGHSSGAPWEITRFNTVFLRIGELNNEDEVIIRKNGKGYKYKVFDKKTISPNEIKYLTENQGNILILQTCTPIGTSLKRLLVFAKPT